MGNSATKLPPAPNAKRAVFDVLDYLRENHSTDKGIDEIEKGLDGRYTQKVLRTALSNLQSMELVWVRVTEKNKHLYRIARSSTFSDAKIADYEILLSTVLHAMGQTLADKGDFTGWLSEQLAGVGNNRQRNMELSVIRLFDIPSTFIQVPVERHRELLVKAVKNDKFLLGIKTGDGQTYQGCLGKVVLRKGAFYMAFYNQQQVFGLYLNEIDSIEPLLGRLPSAFTKSVESAIYNLVNSAFDGALLSDGGQIVLEVHPDSAQTLLWGRPQSDFVEIDEVAADGWIRFTQSDDIRQELVDLLAGMAGRVRVVGPDELRDLVADRIQEIASTVG